MPELNILSKSQGLACRAANLTVSVTTRDSFSRFIKVQKHGKAFPSTDGKEHGQLKKTHEGYGVEGRTKVGHCN